MRVAIYARFSTEGQREASLDDQTRNCERHADREGWHVVARFTDRAISGTKRDRPGYQAMLAAAKRREFDVLVVDDLSRLSRDEIELKQTVRRFRFAGLRIVSVSDGFDTNAKGHKIQATVRGLLNEIYLDDLAEKTHRGLTGQALKGFNTGGRSYGYRHLPIVDASQSDEYGRPRVIAARREIDSEQAKVVRLIFSEFADGRSPRAIAIKLNQRGIPSPRGGTWAVSAIYGDRRTGVGILNNPTSGASSGTDRAGNATPIPAGAGASSARGRVDCTRDESLRMSRPSCGIAPRPASSAANTVLAAGAVPVLGYFSLQRLRRALREGGRVSLRLRHTQEPPAGSVWQRHDRRRENRRPRPARRHPATQNTAE